MTHSITFGYNPKVFNCAAKLDIQHATTEVVDTFSCSILTDKTLPVAATKSCRNFTFVDVEMLETDIIKQDTKCCAALSTCHPKSHT